MGSNSFGKVFQVHTFGESHGVAYGVVIDGCPAGVSWNQELLESKLNLRKPGQSEITSQRREEDIPELLSGVYAGKTLGSPIAIIVRNNGQQSKDYDNMPERKGHADSVYKTKYGHADLRGGGRSSGRETLCRVIGGAVAQMFCQEIVPEIKVHSYTSQVGEFKLASDIEENVLLQSYNFKTRIPDMDLDTQISDLLVKALESGESYGGMVDTVLLNTPSGLGSPVFEKFKSDLSLAMMSIGATLGVEFGGGFKSLEVPGTVFHGETVDYYGGLSGGLSSGKTINFKVGFKPTSSILDIAKNGRHDPCIVPRAVPVVEAMTWLTVANHLLLSRLDRV